MADRVARLIADTYRWQRRLGARVIPAPSCCIVASPEHPDVWEANHADEVTARTGEEIDAVFAAMDRHLGHTPWRVVHTDCFSPDAFLARLALDFDERFVAIQMALEGDLADRGAPVTLRPVVDDADFDALLRLVIVNHAERQETDGLPPEFSAAMVEVYRSKRDGYRFHLAIKEGVPIAYGGSAAAPNGAGMIDDLFTLPSERRRGVITGMIAALVDDLRARGCEPIFLGALANDRPKRLYARLGFRPVTLARTWARKLPD
ncbi:MAG TPA: GNAT family N-acetyltransferase [Roseiarcus sp.]